MHFSGRRRIRPSPTPPSPENESDMASDYVEPDEHIVAAGRASVHTQNGPDAELSRVASEYDAWGNDDNSPASPFVERKPDED